MEEQLTGISEILEKKQSFGLSRFPIGFWNYVDLGRYMEHQDEAAVAEWEEMGVTVTQGPEFDSSSPAHRAHVTKMLDWCGKYGIKLIIADGRCRAKPAIGPGFRTDVESAVGDFGGHPATFGFHVGDEPGPTHIDAFAECMRIDKEIAPNLHPFSNLLAFWPEYAMHPGFQTPEEYLESFARKSSADLLCYDNYTQMWPGEYGAHPSYGRTGWDRWFRNLKIYRAAANRCGIPFWVTPLCVGHRHYKCPSFDDLRWQFNTAICAGASGIQWFFYYMRPPEENYRFSPVDEFWEKTGTYFDLRRIHNSFNRRYGDLFNRLVSTRVTFTNKPFGEGELFTPNGLVSIATPDPAEIDPPQPVAGIPLNPSYTASEYHPERDPRQSPLMIGEFVDKEAKRYVMLVNNSTTQDVRVLLGFPGKDVRVYSWDWDGHEYEGKAYSAVGDITRTDDCVTISHWLAPGQETVYRVESAGVKAVPVVLE
jgi:hypothetical protein